MATPTLQTTGLTTITTADATTGFTGTSVNLEPDLKKEGSNSIACILRNDLATIYYDNGGGGSSIDLTGEHVRAWINFGSVGFLDSEVNNGMEFFMYDGTNTAYWVMFGSDTYAGGWKNVVLDCDLAPDSGSFNKASVQRWGFRFNRTGAPANKDNAWVDYFRYGDGYYATGGTSGDEIELAGIYSQDLASGYGVIDIFEGVYYSYGGLIIGNGATTTWFQMVGDVLVFTDSKVASGLYSLSGVGTGCRVTISNSVIRSAGSGTNTRFAVDMSNADLLSCTITDNLFTHAGDITYKSGQTATGNTYEDCLQIIPQGADIQNSSIAGYEGTTDTGAISYDETSDPDGEFDGTSITKGTASTHAIEFGINSPTSITLRDMDFSGYNAVNGNTDSTFLVRRTSGTVTINIIGGSGNTSYKTLGATVNIVSDPVTALITVVDVDTALPIQNARVFMAAADGTGDLGFEDSVTITRVTTTATVAHTAHPYVVGNKVNIVGANQSEYNGAKTITAITTNSYDFTVSGSPTTPATGTITSTGLVLEGLTDVDGKISDTRSYSVDQPIVGHARKSSASPYYKNGPFTGDINASSGYSQVQPLIKDE